MKIDIGSTGRILGTKRVSPNGQISGFREYAGRDVLVLLPGEAVPVVRRDAADVLREAEALVRERMELAFREYKHLKARYPTPEAAARSFLDQLTSLNVRGLVQRADVWIRDQLGAPDLAARKRTRPRKA